MALPAILARMAGGAAGSAMSGGSKSPPARPSVQPAVDKMGAVSPRKSSASLTVAKTNVTPSEAISDSPVKMLRSIVKMISKMSSGIDEQNKITIAQAKAEKEDRLEGSPASRMQRTLQSGMGEHTKKLGIFTLALGGLVLGAKEMFGFLDEKFSFVGDKLSEFGRKLIDILPDFIFGGEAQASEPSAPSGGGRPARRGRRSRSGGGRASPSSSPGRTSTPGGARMANVKRVIQRAESKGNPDALNGENSRGKMIATTGKKAFGRSMTTMTIREVRNAQKRFEGAGGGTGAAGLYQIIPKTLDELMEDHGKWHGLDWNDKFSAANQDKLADALLYGKRKITDDMSENDVIDRLAMEWAGLPVSRSRKGHSRRVRAGQSYYAGTQGNKAGVSVSAVRGALRQDRSAPRAPRRASNHPIGNAIEAAMTLGGKAAAAMTGNKQAVNLNTPVRQVPTQLAALTSPAQNTTVIQAPSNLPQDQTQIVTPNRDNSSDYGWYFGTQRA